MRTTQRPAVPTFGDRSGRGAACDVHAACSGHGMLARKVCERIGVAFEDMRGIRLEIEYPPLNSEILLRFDLPERPN